MKKIFSRHSRYSHGRQAPLGNLQRLDQVREGSRVKIISINGGRGMRTRLTKLGIHPGEIGVIKRNGFGPILLSVNGNNIALGRGVAAQIEVMVIY